MKKATAALALAVLSALIAPGVKDARAAEGLDRAKLDRGEAISFPQTADIAGKHYVGGVAYAIIGPFYPLLKLLFGGSMTTTEVLGRAMVRAAKSGAPRTILETRDINALGGASP